MSKVCLFHWKTDEVPERLARLERAGWAATHVELESMAVFRALREDPPAAVVIDLSRLPSHGRDVAVALRHFKGTRQLPIVFVEGAPEKVARIREMLPDAVYASWRGIKGALKRAIARPPDAPVTPRSLLEGYSGTPLPRKLGIKPDLTVALLAAPPDFAQTLGPLPAGVKLRRQARGRSDLIVWFVTSLRELQRRLAQVTGALTDRGGLWIAWPKQASGMATDLNQNIVRRVGLAAGLVDHKVCAIDSIWSGLRFVRRKERAGKS
jgi:hypothetical protein